MKRRQTNLISAAIPFIASTTMIFMVTIQGSGGEARLLDAKMHHLRIAGPLEWAEFSERPEVVVMERRIARSQARELIEDLLAGSASDNRTGGGVPY